MVRSLATRDQCSSILKQSGSYSTCQKSSKNEKFRLHCKVLAFSGNGAKRSVHSVLCLNFLLSITPRKPSCTKWKVLLLASWSSIDSTNMFYPFCVYIFAEY